MDDELHQQPGWSDTRAETRIVVVASDESVGKMLSLAVRTRQASPARISQGGEIMYGDFERVAAAFPSFQMISRVPVQSSDLSPTVMR